MAVVTAVLEPLDVSVALVENDDVSLFVVADDAVCDGVLVCVDIPDCVCVAVVEFVGARLRVVVLDDVSDASDVPVGVRVDVGGAVTDCEAEVDAELVAVDDANGDMDALNDGVAEDDDNGEGASEEVLLPEGAPDVEGEDDVEAMLLSDALDDAVADGDGALDVEADSTCTTVAVDDESGVGDPETDGELERELTCVAEDEPLYEDVTDAEDVCVTDGDIDVDGVEESVMGDGVGVGAMGAIDTPRNDCPDPGVGVRIAAPPLK